VLPELPCWQLGSSVAVMRLPLECGRVAVAAAADNIGPCTCCCWCDSGPAWLGHLDQTCPALSQPCSIQHNTSEHTRHCCDI
jgi:hypothetical protein